MQVVKSFGSAILLISLGKEAKSFQTSLARVKIPHAATSRNNFSQTSTAANVHLPSSVSSTFSLSAEASPSSSGSTEESKCPATQFANKVTKKLEFTDRVILSRILRIANHAPALLSLSYFGLISMASMMSMGPMATSSAAEATLSSVLVKTVGPTTNAAFAAAFPTFVTPASFVFLVWPLIAVLQLITVTISALFPGEEEILSQKDLSSLTIANLFSSAWLFASSNASAGNLPISSCLVLPFVPLFSGYPLRNKPKYILWAFQVYSSFTTLASILAFTVEMQYGGRIPTIGKIGSELGGIVFLSLYSMVSLAVPNKTGAKKLVNFGALSGILAKRVATVAAAGTSWFSGLFLSITFWGTVGCWFWSLRELFPQKSN